MTLRGSWPQAPKPWLPPAGLEALLPGTLMGPITTGPLPSDPEGPVGTPAPSQPSWAPLHPEIFLVGVLFLQRPQADCARMTGGGGDSEGLPDTGMGPLQTDAGVLSSDSRW